MMLVGVMAAVMWGIGMAMGAPRRARVTMILVLILGVIIAQLILPDGHPLREATGGDVRLWALIVGFGVVVALYRSFLVALRARIPQEQVQHPARRSDSFSETELDRYARHIVLREVGGAGQKALRNAKVLVVGAGGLGSPVLQYLAAAGIGTIGVIDDDQVENANLQRQVIHRDSAIGMTKTQSAAEAMQVQNPFVTVRPYNRRLTADIATELIGDYDLVIDGTDNFPTRYLVNETCVALETPLISGALTQWEGQVNVFDPAHGTPCYACIFPSAPDPALAPSCAEAGVIGPLPGVIGTMMAIEAIKRVTGAGETLAGRMLIYDALYAETRIITVKPDPDCPTCGGRGLRAG